jgi:zinc/manganese transport system substrate-binding protein
MPFRRSGTALVALATLALSGCGAGSTSTPAAPPGDAPLTVVTSTNVYGSIAQAVGGNRVTVTSLINNPAADPHSYESTPADAAKVTGANIVLYNGGGYDDFVPRLVQSAGGKAAVIDVTQLSGLAPPEASGSGAAPAAAPSFNEHFWYSLPTVQKVATQLATDLGAADSANAAQFTSNAQAFNAKVADLLTKEQAIAAAHPGARVAITEPVPGYLVKAAGLDDVTPPAFTKAVEEDTDPPAVVLQQTLALFTGDPVRALILNAQTETPTTTQVAKAAQSAGVPVVKVTETLPAGVNDYVSWMGSEIDAVANALNGR